MNIYFDIETIPAQDPVAIELIKADIEKQKLSVKAPSNYKDQEKIDAYIKVEVEKLDAEFDATYRKTSFDGGLGQICCISYAIDDQAPVSIYHECETDILDFFYHSLKSRYDPSSQTRPKFIGHNIVERITSVSNNKLFFVDAALSRAFNTNRIQVVEIVTKETGEEVVNLIEIPCINC